ncbi:MAG: heavy metal translocating P-type ATPase [Myxococcota bacterium]
MTSLQTISLEQSSRACTYCGTRTRRAASASGHLFCCNGCETAHRLIREAGLNDGFATVLGEARPARPREDAQSFQAFDDPGYLAEHGREHSAGVYAVDLVLEGVHCAGCLWLLEKLPRLCHGVSSARLNLAQARLTVVFEPARAPLSKVTETLSRLGYAAHPARDASRLDMRRRQDRVMLMRMGVAFAVAANVMLMAVALYCGDRFGIAPEVRRFLRWASLVVTLPSLLFSALPFFRGAWAALRTRTAHIDLALALSLGAGYLQGIVNTVRNSGAIYFDSVTALVFALLASRYVHQRKQRQAADATELLAALAPSVAHRRGEGGAVTDVASASVVLGDIIEVRAGEAFPVDGEVLAGSGCVDTALLSGESEPVDVRAGDAVHAGTICAGAMLLVRATATGGDTRLARLTRTMQAAATTRAEIIELTDRFGAYFVIGASLLAAATVIAAWPLGADIAIDRAIALLIVACPCALGLATPLAMSSAMAAAARQRILIKTSAALERLTRVETVIFDKTGTLTEGRLTVAHWFGERDVRDAVRALEGHVNHPVARALEHGGEARPLIASQVKQHPGLGVTGVVGGAHLIIGAPHWVAANTANGKLWEEMAGDLAQQGMTPVLVAKNHEVVALAGLADRLRDDARETVAALQARGLILSLVSGDDPRVVSRVARQLGIERFEALASPERKLAIVRDLETHSSVAMVGDGVNDAAALAAATVGIAVHGGAEASMAAADVYIDRPGLAAIADTFQGAHRAGRVVRIGIAFGLIYNVIGVYLAVSGVVTPLMAALLMPAASLTVVTLAHTMRTFGARR